MAVFIKGLELCKGLPLEMVKAISNRRFLSDWRF